MQVNPFSILPGKTALVTGCDKGIGKAMALALAACGVNIVGASRSLQAGSSVEATIRAGGGNFTPHQVDLSERDSVYAFIKNVQARHTIDILVNNAGTIQRFPAAEHGDESWDQVINTNLHAPFILARAFGKEMLTRGWGRIIFTCSLLSYQGGINVPGYTASKAAVAGLVKALSNEWAAKGVTVNGIAPGYIETDNTQALREDPVRSRSILERIPAGRWGQPEDLGGPVAFLCSEAAAYITGTILDVDGGWMAR